MLGADPWVHKAGFPFLVMMARASRELAEAQRAHFPAQRLLCDRQAELVPHPFCQIDEAPTDHTVRCRDRTCLDLLGESTTLCIIQDRDCARGFARYQSVRAVGVETDYLVPNDLQGHSSHLGRFATASTIQDHAQR